MGRGMYPPQPSIYINNLNDKVKKEGQYIPWSVWQFQYIDLGKFW